jgi:hypothetical protein
MPTKSGLGEDESGVGGSRGQNGGRQVVIPELSCPQHLTETWTHPSPPLVPRGPNPGQSPTWLLFSPPPTRNKGTRTSSLKGWSATPVSEPCLAQGPGLQPSTVQNSKIIPKRPSRQPQEHSTCHHLHVTNCHCPQRVGNSSGHGKRGLGPWACPHPRTGIFCLPQPASPSPIWEGRAPPWELSPLSL